MILMMTMLACSHMTPTEAFQSYVSFGQIPDCKMFEEGQKLGNIGVVDRINFGTVVVVVNRLDTNTQMDLLVPCNSTSDHK